MKMKAKAVLVVAASVVLASCGTRTVIVEVPVVQTTVETTTSSTTTTTEPQLSAREKERIFVDAVRDEHPQIVKDMGSAWIIEFGYTICNSIDSGLTMRQFAVMLMENDIEHMAEAVGFIAGSAIYMFCPENEYWINSSGT
jgi:hypothetical protein